MLLAHQHGIRWCFRSLSVPDSLLLTLGLRLVDSYSLLGNAFVRGIFVFFAVTIVSYGVPVADKSQIKRKAQKTSTKNA